MNTHKFFRPGLLFLTFFLVLSMEMYSQSDYLSFRVVNPRVIRVGGFDCLQFQVDVKNNTPSGAYYTNIAAYWSCGTSQADSPILWGTGGGTVNGTFARIGLSLDAAKYPDALITCNVNSSGRAFISVGSSKVYVLGNDPSIDFVQVPSTWTPLIVVQYRLNASTAHLISNLRWNTFTDANSSRYADQVLGGNSVFPKDPGLSNKYYKEGWVSLSEPWTKFLNMYCQRIYSDWIGWSQVGAATNAGGYNLNPYTDWSAAVNTSVYDIGASPAEITQTGSKANALRIHPGAQLKINPGKDLTCTGDAEINGAEGLIISSTADGAGAFIDNGTISYPNSGSARVERYLTACDVGLPTQGCWHYVTPPISDALSGVFFADWLKTWDETTGAWSDYITSTTQPLGVMQGYIVSRPTVNNTTKSYIGTLNTNCSAKSLTYTNGAGTGWNLTGNPYPSPIDLESGSITWNNVDAKVWYYSKYNKTYKPYVVTGPQETNPGTRYAPAGQGFFAHVTASGSASLTIANGARTATYDTIFYKNTNSTPNVLWMTAEGPTGMTDEAVVYFRDDATAGYDQPFDCQKLWGTDDALQLFSMTDANYPLAINACSFTGVNTVIPLNFSIFTSNASGNYTLNASKLESFRAGTTITLEDKKTSQLQELTFNPVYAFSYADGDNPARFLLHFHNPYFGVPENGMNKALTIYSHEKTIYLKVLHGNPERGELYLYNLLGEKIASRPVGATLMNSFTMSLPAGYYIARAVTGQATITAKVYLF